MAEAVGVLDQAPAAALASAHERVRLRAAPDPGANLAVDVQIRPSSVLRERSAGGSTTSWMVVQWRGSG
jgi:hypothetical protein